MNNIPPQLVDLNMIKDYIKEITQEEVNKLEIYMQSRIKLAEKLQGVPEKQKVLDDVQKMKEVLAAIFKERGLTPIKVPPKRKRKRKRKTAKRFI